MAEVYFKKSNQVANSLTIQFNGTNKVTFNGSSAGSVNITPSAIGAATSNHTHTWSQIQNKPILLTPNDILSSLSSATDNTKVLGAKLVADLLNQGSLRLLKNVTDFNVIEDGLWMFDTTYDITNSPPYVWNGIIFQHTYYMPNTNYAIKYQILLQSNGKYMWSRLCWYNTWQNWSVINQPHMDINATNNIITDCMAINTNGDISGDYMKPGIIATEDASSLINSPIRSGPFYAFRKVYVVNTKIMVELHECYPRYGRIWSNCYDMNPQAWMNGGHWKPAQLYYHNTNYRDIQIHTTYGPHEYSDIISDLPSDAVITGIWTKLDTTLPIIITKANIDTASKALSLTVWSLNEDGLAPSTIKCTVCYGYSYFN